MKNGCNMIIYAFTAVGALYLVKLFLTPEPKPIAGVYKVPGVRYNVKYCFFRLILWLRQRKNQKLKSTSGQNAGYGVRSRISPEDMDKAQDLPDVNDHPKVKTPPTLISFKLCVCSVPGTYFIYCHLACSFIAYFSESEYRILLKKKITLKLGGSTGKGIDSELVAVGGSDNLICCRSISNMQGYHMISRINH